MGVPQARAPRSSARLPLSAVALGAAFALFVIVSWVSMKPAWALYFCIAAMIVACVPVIFRLTGQMEDLLAFLFVLSLQFSMSFNIVYEVKALPGGTQGINISLVFLCSLAWWGMLLFNRMGTSAEPIAFDRKFLKACIAFVVISGFSVINASTRTYTAWGLFYNTTMIGIALTAAHLCSTRRGIRILWDAGMVLIVMQASVLILQRLLNLSFAMNGDVLDNRGEIGRFGGTVGMAPANVATLLMIFLFFVEKRLFAAVDRRTFMWTSTVFGMGGVCLLLSLTRSCWIGFIGGSIFLTIRAIREGKILPSRLVTLGVAALACLVAAWGPVHDRLGANHRGAFDERWLLNYIDLEMIKAHPVVGVGLNNAYESLRLYVPSFFGEGDWVYLAHNQFLHVTAETGLLGLASFVWIIALVVRRLRAARGSEDDLLSSTVTVLLAVIGSLIWGMQLDFYSGMQMYVMLWFMLGASVGVAGLVQRERAQREAAGGGATLAA